MLHNLAKILFTLLLYFFLSLQALAVNPDERLSDPALEARARNLSAELRCLVCQNQSIDDSDAQLARDLRILVREKLLEGKSDNDILEYLVERYGEFVLLKPRFSSQNIVLWGLPLFVFLAGLWILRGMFSLGSSQLASMQSSELSDEEKVELSKILKSKKDN